MDCCAKLSTITPIYFEFKADQKKTRKVGLLAQEVQSVCPEIISTDPKGFLGMSYQDIVPLLVKAVNELTERVTILEGQCKK